ncbi:MAG: zinc metallopeptidase [Coriobacteriia bacterium]|nr:zinc metallopeptidase [Coriobacteriia bacterium]
MYFPIGFGGSGYWMVFFIIPMILGACASGAANRRLNKYAQVANDVGLTGAQAAANMLNFHEVSGVGIGTGGSGQDFYNPKDNTISLSSSYYSQASVTAIAVACHEAGHACQHAQGYGPIKFRTALVPVVNMVSNAWIFILLAGIIFNIVGLSYIAVIAFGLTLLFHLVTLPVEFNASTRAIKYLETLSLSDNQFKACKRILWSCAMTYVVAALISALQLIWVLLRTRRD